MNKSTIIVACALGLSSSLVAQSYTGVIETDQILSSMGDPVNFGESIDGQPLNVFFGTTALDVPELDSALANITDLSANDLETIQSTLDDPSFNWKPMIEATFNENAEWFTGLNTSLSVNERPIVAIMNAAGPDSLVEGSELGVLASPFVPTSTLNNFLVSFNEGNIWDVVVGQEGSVQLETIAVPEPGHFAALLGFAGLALVVVRRRRNR